MKELVAQAEKLFPGEVNQVDMRAQLQYFHFMNYDDKVVYMDGFQTSVRVIQEQLTLFCKQE